MKKLFTLVFMICAGFASTCRGEVFFLNEPMDKIPAAADVQKPESMQIIDGRMKDRQEKALLLKDGSITWQLKEMPAEVMVEFWLKHQAWNAQDKGKVVLCRFRIGNDEFELLKPEGKSELNLAGKTDVLQIFPIYNWIKQPWMNRDERDLWHYVNIQFSGNRIFLTVDGFTALEKSAYQTKGSLNGLTLLGSPGTAFSSLHIVGSAPLTLSKLRERYRSFYNGTPFIHKNTITVPMLKSLPLIDGSIDPKEWANAAKITGFSTVNRGCKQEVVLSDPVTAYIGYDKEHLYMAFQTPYQGVLDAKDWGATRNMRLYREESYEIFLLPPWTGSPEYVQLVGNPYGSQMDLKVFNQDWDGRWDWKASIGKNEWSAEFGAKFSGIDALPPADGAVWGMNLFNSKANAAWSYPGNVYHNWLAFGILRFEKDTPVIRPDYPRITTETIVMPMEIIGSGKQVKLSVGLEVYGERDIVPARQDVKEISIPPGKKEQLSLTVPLTGIPEGRFALYVRDDTKELYYLSAKFPSAPKVVVRSGVLGKDTIAEKKTEKDTAIKKEITEEEKAYARKWTAEELGKTLLQSTEWQNNKLGISDTVPAPWTPMEVKDQTVECWGRQYIYKNSILPVQIKSGGEELFAGNPQFILKSGRDEFKFQKAKVKFEKVSDSLVRATAISESGPYALQVTSDYEFDGMGKVVLSLSSSEGNVSVDNLQLEFPLKAERSVLYHFTTTSGRPPETDSGEIPKDGFSLNLFHELIWLGDHKRGFCWFAEGMENWRLQNEEAIQVIEPVKNGMRLFRIKLADKPFILERPLRLVFGIQATPVKPRPADFRSRFSWDKIDFVWFFGDGDYYPFQQNPEKGREYVKTKRAVDKEVMPVSSPSCFGVYRFLANDRFSDIADPGLMIREIMLWGPLWELTATSPSLPVIPEKHTAPGDDWYGKRGKPWAHIYCCPASPFQDYYIWELNKLIKGTDVGAWYLDLVGIVCANPHHGCGYINYKGEWTPQFKIFATRDMMKRIYRLFYDAHGKTFINLHSSNQVLVPLISFADIFWDGENYGDGPRQVYEFYSAILSDKYLQAQHTGLPFGFTPLLGPSFKRSGIRYSPSPASPRDMFGIFTIHDSLISVINADIHDELVGFMERKWLSFDLEHMQVSYYWEDNKGIRIEPAQVKHILYYKKDQAVLGLYNWSDETVLATVQLNRLLLGMNPGTMSVTDALTAEKISEKAESFQILIAPRDFRLLDIK